MMDNNHFTQALYLRTAQHVILQIKIMQSISSIYDI